MIARARNPNARSFSSRRWLLRAAGAVLVAFGASLLVRAGLVAALLVAPNAPLPWRQRHAMKVPVALEQRHVLGVRSPLASGGGALASWIVEPSGPAKATLVLLHGLRMDKSVLAPLAVAVADAGYRAVLIDLRGHGESDGSYLTYGASDAPDVSRLLDGLSGRGLALGPVGVYGFSYGGAVAIDLAASDARVESVLAVSPFSSLRQVVGDYRREYLPRAAELVPDSWFRDAVDGAGRLGGFDVERASPLFNVSKLRAPLLLIHGDADTQVPLAHSRRLLAASAGRAKLEILHGATHASMPQDDWRAVRGRVVSWFEQTLVPR